MSKTPTTTSTKQTATTKQPEPAVAAPPTTQAPRPSPSRAKAPDPRVFSVTAKAFAPSKGLASALYAAMRTLGSATAQQAADALLASGEYQKVAPQAAKLRPVRPVLTLLARWQGEGVVEVKR